tara:strand:- start:688 stop:2913 length:2226 start_codon:yes stop_codon:yes gene_type:complete
MANTVSDIIIKFKEHNATKVGAAFQRISREARVLEKTSKRVGDVGIKFLRKELESLRNANVNSISSMKAQRNALIGLRDMADVAGNEFKQLTAEIKQMDAALAKSQGQKAGRGGKLAGIAKGAGAVAAGGIFGGVEGAAGAGIGLAISGGNPAAAAVGAAVGAQVKMVRESIGEIATYNAALERQRQALSLVIDNNGQYIKSQQFLAETSKNLAIPQDVIVRQFTSLTASVKGAGKETRDAEKVFKAIAAGIRGTGGNLEDMKAAMRATSQVFSKGKVSAEELRQQLGERLPGAFTLFAESMGKTPAELDKALEQGKVTLDDFMKFAEKLFDTYGENAEILADSPAAAGDRLATAISELKDNLGEPVSAIGAMFQNMSTTIVNSINDATNSVQNRMAGLLTRSISKRTRDIEKLQEKTDKAFEDLRKAAQGRAITLDTGSASLGTITVSGQVAIDMMRERYEAAKAAQDENLDKLLEDKKKRDDILAANMKPVEIMGMLFHPVTYQYLGQADGSEDPSKVFDKESSPSPTGIGQGIQDYFNSIKKGSEEVRAVVSKAFKSMEDAIVNFVMTGKLNFADFTRSILADMARIIVRQAIMKPILSAFGFGDGGVVSGGTASASGEVTMANFNAMGNAYGRNGIQKFARGGVVHSPTIFPFKNGIGLMGEAGSEAILPLKRTKQGKLGVESSGGGGGNVVNVSVNAGGTSAQGNTMKANQLGKMIGTAIEAELIKQKRPGGILYT